MKRTIILFLTAVMLFSLCACSKQELVNMAVEVQEDYVEIIYGDKTYIPYCVISKTECGEQIGVIADREDKIYEYKGYSVDEWIIDFFPGDNIAMLYREVSVTDIPDGLESEYEWNN